MKKQLFQVFVFASIFSMTSQMFSMAAVENAPAALVDNSGEDKIVNIMSQIKHDVVPGVVDTISYVQVANIDQDLNIKEIANFFAPKTVMGKAFLVETLQRPVSPIDQSGIVALRSNAVQQLVENPELKQQVEEILAIAAEKEKIVVELMSNTFRGQTCPEFEGLKKMKQNNDPNYGLVNALLTNRAWKTGLYALNVMFLAHFWNKTYQYGNNTIKLLNGQPIVALDNLPADYRIYALIGAI